MTSDSRNSDRSNSHIVTPRPMYREEYERARREADCRETEERKRVQNNPYLQGNDDAADLLKEDITPPPFLIDQILYAGEGGEGGTVAFLAGNPGIGKTMAALQMLVAVGQGLPWLGFQTVPAPVGGIFLEPPRWNLYERLNAICNGWLPKGVVYVKTAADLRRDSLDVCDPRERDWIVEYIHERELRLLVMDPFASLTTLDENKTNEAIKIGNALKYIARVAEVSIVLIDHFRKSGLGNGGSEDVLQGLRGSIAKSAFAGAAMALDQHLGVVRLRFGKVAARKIPDPVHLIRDSRNGTLSVTDAPKDQREVKAGRLESLAEFVRDGKPHTAEEMAERIGVKPNTICRRYVQDLGMVKIGGGRNMAYKIPDTGVRPVTVRESPQGGFSS